MERSATTVLVISIIGGIIILIVFLHLFIVSHFPQEHLQLHCLQRVMESVPHMKWNCYYYTH
ncbi:MAG: hypothetical protein WA833_04590 [Nitrosotalea sp.]